MATFPNQASSDDSTAPAAGPSAEQKSAWSWKRLFGKDDADRQTTLDPQQELSKPSISRRLSRKVVPGLPRPGTFKRQQSELRDRLEPVRPNNSERRAVSADRRKQGSTSSALPPSIPRLSAPEIMATSLADDEMPLESKEPEITYNLEEVSKEELAGEGQMEEPSQALSSQPPASVPDMAAASDDYEEELMMELEQRWILNLSMHFRDRSKREKFFVTFAETPSRWRRVTISVDYRNAPLGSLESELELERYQRDKSARIYEAIRESLSDIQFYDTVTNLKLVTENERLHVHVTQDLSEIIQYPPVSAVDHLVCRRIPEEDIVFDSHLSGFVYKVQLDGKSFIKKEIPGPDTVEEFLYEINALHNLSGSRSVIKFEGIIVDNSRKFVKGLLIAYAERGALVDILYDEKGHLAWELRERWARQIVQGLSEVHEAGFVQGDFTLSNIVIDGDNNAKIIDINRRGCPMRWEPPELSLMIKNHQRISMYIGVKSDVWQLGICLWALAMEEDEPEMQPQPLTLANDSVVIPSYYSRLVGMCLQVNPRLRGNTTTLLTLFPTSDEDTRLKDETAVISETLVINNGTESGNVPALDTGRNSAGLDQGSKAEQEFYGSYRSRDASLSSFEAYPVRGRSPASGPHDPSGPKDLRHAHIITVSPSDRLGDGRFALDGLALGKSTESNVVDPGPRETAPAFGKVDGDLIGVGGHANGDYEALEFSIDDDLTTPATV